MNISLWLKLLPTLLPLLGAILTAFSTHNFTVLGSDEVMSSWTSILQTFGLGAGGVASMLAGLLADFFRNGQANTLFDRLTKRLASLEAAHAVPGAFGVASPAGEATNIIAVQLPGVAISIDVQQLPKVDAAARDRIVNSVRGLLMIPIPDPAQ